MPPLAAGQQYVWNVRAYIGRKAQSPTAWQNVVSSGGGGSTSTAQGSAPSVPAVSAPRSEQSGSTSSNQNQQPSAGSTSSAGGSLQWAAVRNAENYYLEIRAGSGRGERVFGRMVRPDAGGCASGGTCSRAVPPLAAGQQHVWNVRAYIGRKAESPTPWQPVR